MTTFLQFYEADPVGTVLGFVGLLLLHIVVTLPLVGAFIYAFYFLLTLPMRRNERARLFLDLLELGLKDGRTPELAVTEASTSRDKAMGVRFHLLAVFINKGHRMSQSLESVPRLLPPQIQAMLKAGERIGDVGKVLPACRQLLNDAVSQVRGAVNYLVVLAFCITPFTIVVPVLLNFTIIPKYKEVFEGVTAGGTMPAFSQLIFSQNRILIGFQVAILCLVWLAMIAYVGGPRLHGWLRRLLPGVIDVALFRLPWRRKRLQRDFSAMLAVLLDAHVTEAEAVSLAADSTGNTVILRRAGKVRALLTNGVKLSEAVRAMDDTGELHWRIANALQRRGGFLRALEGWHESLDARAFQLEQSAAQITTTAFVLFNGIVVACIVIAVFLLLLSVLDHALLW